MGGRLQLVARERSDGVVVVLKWYDEEDIAAAAGWAVGVAMLVTSGHIGTYVTRCWSHLVTEVPIQS